MSMKKFLTVVCLGAALTVVGCEKKKPSPTPAPGSSGVNSATDALNNATATMKKTAARLQEEAVGAAEGLYDSAKEEFDALADRISKSESPEKSTWQQLADGVKSQLAAAKDKLETMRDENADWKKLSGEFGELMKGIGDSIKSLASKVK